MMREFAELLDESITRGFESGIDMFLEGLETDLSKAEIMESFGGTKNYINAMMEAAYGDINNSVIEEQQDEVDGLVNFLDSTLD